MAKLSKRARALREKLEPGKQYAVDEAFALLKDLSTVKFEESVDVSVNLGVDPRKSDQVVRGSTVLPNGTGKSVRVAVFAQGANADAAKEAGADVIGFEDLAAEVKAGKLDFDVVIATPDAMRVVGQLGPVLGPRGLMPNPKTGTVTMNIEQTIKELKAGRIEYRVDKQANVAAAVGKISFDPNKIEENVKAFVDAIVKAKPASAKGAYFLGASICSTMSPGLKLDHQQLLADLKK